MQLIVGKLLIYLVPQIHKGSGRIQKGGAYPEGVVAGPRGGAGTFQGPAGIFNEELRVLVNAGSGLCQIDAGGRAFYKLQPQICFQGIHLLHDSGGGNVELSGGPVEASAVRYSDKGIKKMVIHKAPFC